MTCTSEKHEKYMRAALDLAEKGLGYVSPNPMVGAVIERCGEIIAEGYHKKYGMPHAEVEALKAFKESGYAAGKDDVMYVTLEPCNHYGKTPPCTEAIMASGIKNLVVAMTDPNPLVAGKGIKRLRDNGIEVTVGVLESEAKKLNKVFIKNMTDKRPFCTAKWAMTLDGKMATDSGDSQWISSEPSRRLVHEWRKQCDAVLVGSGTATHDNPRLNVRMVEGDNPYRVVIDSKAALSIDSNLVKCPDPDKTIVVAGENADKEKIEALRGAGVEVATVKELDGRVDLKEAYQYLASRKLMNLFCEAGPVLQGALLQAGLIDSVLTFVSPKISGGSLNSPFSTMKLKSMSEAVLLDEVSLEIVGEDILIKADVRRRACLRD